MFQQIMNGVSLNASNNRKREKLNNTKEIDERNDWSLVLFFIIRPTDRYFFVNNYY